MPGHVTFAFDSSSIRSNFFEVLTSVAIVLRKYDKTIIEVAGHSDSSGSDEYNLELSGRRAVTVAQYLEAQGVTPERFSILAFGERVPIASNATPEGRQQNRRVEVSLLAVTN